MIIQYKTHDGYTVKGRLLDNHVYTSTVGVKFVFVDNFVNRVKLVDIVSPYQLSSNGKELV